MNRTLEIRVKEEICVVDHVTMVYSTNAAGSAANALQPSPYFASRSPKAYLLSVGMANAPSCGVDSFCICAEGSH